MMCIKHDSNIKIDSKSIESKDPTEVQLVKDLVKSKITCCLINNNRHPDNCDNNSDYSIDSDIDIFPIVDQLKYEFNPNLETHFIDISDPRRKRFDASLDYNRDPKSLKFKHKKVKHKYRNWQLTDQMHLCCFTCFKYNKTKVYKHIHQHNKSCRFHFPYCLECYSNETIIKVDKDNNHRKRVRAMPPRNNANINNCFVNPLICLAHNGNCDIQYVDNPYGACEYSASYSSKADEPDEKTMVKLFIRKIIQDLKRETENTNNIGISYKNNLLAVANAMQESIQVGQVQASAFLMKLKFVESTCNVLNVNTLEEKNVDQIVATDKQFKNNQNKSESVLFKGPKSQMGRRIAYSEICDSQLNQFNQCQVTLFSILSCYNIQSITDSSISKVKLNKIIYLHNLNVGPITISDDTGLVNNIPPIQKFRTNNFVFTKYRKNWIINLCPKIPIDYNNERSVYSTLILHCPYPLGGEKNLIIKNKSIIETYEIYEKNKLIPKYVEKLHKKIKESESLFSNLNEDNILEFRSDNNFNNDNINDNNNEIFNEQNNNNNNISLNDLEELLNQQSEQNNNDTKLNIIYPINYNINNNNNNNNNVLSCETSEIIIYRDFIDTKLKEAIEFREQKFQINNNDKLIMKNSTWTNIPNHSYTYDVHDSVNRLRILNEKLLSMSLNSDCNNQLEVINKYKKYLPNYPFDSNHNKDKQIIGFVSGQGGTGKTEIIKILTEYCNVTFGKTEGKFGQTLNCGPTGSSGIIIFIILFNYIFYKLISFYNICRILYWWCYISFIIW
jgi:hypothetical protein